VDDSSARFLGRLFEKLGVGDGRRDAVGEKVDGPSKNDNE